ncbi:MAG: SDR family oxidoreductase [Desulfobacterales bacterium]|nr:SDR family oxidoreductase [Desulfobacterales bacterium]
MTKSIMITGASSGIGRSLAHEMAGRGYALALAARRLEELQTVRTDIERVHPAVQVSVRRLDVTEYDTISPALQGFAEDLGGLDIVFANAGIGLGEKIGTGEFSSARRTIETNLIGAMATVDAAVAYFLQRGSGHIVGTSSVAAFRGTPRGSSYCASKAGFACYLEALRAEAYRKNIAVTVFYPGYIDTPLNRMLRSRPFLISTEKAALLMANLIERKVRSSTVPAMPWCIIARLLKILPTRIIAGL